MFHEPAVRPNCWPTCLQKQIFFFFAGTEGHRHLFWIPIRLFCSLLSLSCCKSRFQTTLLSFLGALTHRLVCYSDGQMDDRFSLEAEKDKCCPVRPHWADSPRNAAAHLSNTHIIKASRLQQLQIVCYIWTASNIRSFFSPQSLIMWRSVFQQGPMWFPASNQLAVSLGG